MDFQSALAPGGLTFCGIAGYVGLNDEALLRRMIEALHHRGPDDTGFYVDEEVGLANARLSIIDIEGGHQPIHNEDGTVHVTYNGEIYNFHELRKALESLGHRFYTQSDTEVIVHSYEEFGEAFASKLNGMFAIALWDSKLDKLLLARDRMGIKPLYYSSRNGAFLFASELKAILQAPIERVVDVKSLHALLNLGYVPGDLTLIQGIRKLPPSSYLVLQDKSVRIKSYWEIPLVDHGIGEDFAIERLRATLSESIRAQLVADVPVGCFLSGGLDTSLVVAYASGASDHPLKTFCMGFGEETDEFKDARLIADHFGTEHYELTVDSSQAMKLYPKMIWHMEAPKYNLYPWFVNELVHKYVKVCLSGNGGDEVFGGYYARYQNALRIEKLARSAAVPILRGVGNALRGLTQDVRRQNRLRVLKSLGDEVKEYLILAGVLPDSFNHRLFKDGKQLSTADLREYYSQFFGKGDFLQGLMDAELRTKLVDDLLSVDDTMSMAHSLELRVPLLDNRIVDLMTSIPWQLKYSTGGFGKLLLRKVLRDVLPEESLRKPKWGFSVNVYSWYNGELGELIQQVLPESEVMREYFSERTIQRLVERPLPRGNRRYQVLLWQLLGFHFWHKIFIDSEKIGAASLDLDALVA